MTSRRLGVTLALAAAASATAPLAPDPSVDLSGRWTIVAVDAQPTGGGRRFNLELNATFGAAQFGCNSGSGTYVVREGWFVAGDWIITAAGCPNPDSWRHFEDKGFQILAKPLAVERAQAGVRLRNERGSIDLVRAPPVSAAEILGSWNVDSINGVATAGDTEFRVTFTQNRIDARFGCNRFRADAYRIEGGRLMPSGGSNTEMACESTGPNAPKVPVMTLEDWGFAVLRSGPELVLRPGGELSLISSKGRIDLSRPN